MNARDVHMVWFIMRSTSVYVMLLKESIMKQEKLVSLRMTT